MLDRLVALINEAKDEYPTIPTVNCCKPTFAYYLANRLLADGVIVPLCKVGDTVYWYDMIGEIKKAQVIEFGFTANLEDVGEYDVRNSDIGKTVFLTREEAEQALKGEPNG